MGCRPIETAKIVNWRTYGQPPYQVAVIHGGPGAPGTMAPVARELAQWCGVLEPLQTKDSIAGLVDELQKVLEEQGSTPVTLIGHSWGAWLSYLLAVGHPALVRKLILVGSGPFEAKYVAQLEATRNARMSEAERRRAQELQQALHDPATRDKAGVFREFGRLMSRVDQFKPLEASDEIIAGPAGELQPEAFLRLMSEANELRDSGELLELGKRIRCPVVGIHGDADPHPVEGVRDALAGVIQDFWWVLLKHCGHTPWNECAARESFYTVLKIELDLIAALDNSVVG